jgi:hypothetical protein
MKNEQSLYVLVDHIDIGDLNNKCLNESIFNNDKTDFDYSNYKYLNESIYSDNNDLVESNNKCLNATKHIISLALKSS